jgi:hypothetical protein
MHRCSPVILGNLRGLQLVQNRKEPIDDPRIVRLASALSKNLLGLLTRQKRYGQASAATRRTPTPLRFTAVLKQRNVALALSCATIAYNMLERAMSVVFAISIMRNTQNVTLNIA